MKQVCEVGGVSEGLHSGQASTGAHRRAAGGGPGVEGCGGPGVYVRGRELDSTCSRGDTNSNVAKQVLVEGEASGMTPGGKEP